MKAKAKDRELANQVVEVLGKMTNVLEQTQYRINLIDWRIGKLEMLAQKKQYAARPSSKRRSRRR